MMKKYVLLMTMILSLIGGFQCRGDQSFADQDCKKKNAPNNNTPPNNTPKPTPEPAYSGLYELSQNDAFMIDYSNSTKDNLRICVPILYPECFSVPMKCVDKIQKINEKNIDGKNFTFAKIKFKSNCLWANTILSSFQELIRQENTKDGALPNNKNKWRGPWTWSKCAKCKLEVNAFITLSVAGAALAAGVTGPGAYAVWQSMIVGKYGAAAWEAVRAVVFSESVSGISQIICEQTGKCN